jgi:zinc D-Ala-D-Ala carboxypeptidase
MSKNFSLAEMVASDTARRKGIDNTPSLEVVSHLDEFCDNLLQPLRDAWGAPINVTSGYRCHKLNQVVGGVATSAHLRGYAADLQISNMKKFDEFVKFVVDWIKDKPFDQCLIEKSGSTRWLHIGYKNSKDEQRRQIKDIIVK